MSLFEDQIWRVEDPDARSGPSDQYAPQEGEQCEGIYATRQISDGRRFTIIKVFYDRTDLERALAQRGFAVALHTLNDVWFFLQAERHRSAGEGASA